MTLDPKRLARDAKRVQATRLAGGLGRQTTGVTRAVRDGLPMIRQLRESGITWAALRADPTIEIRDRAGHADVEQTNDYMRRASACGDVGEPFPDLGPLFHIVPGIVPERRHKTRNGSKAAVSVVRRGGLEPP